MCVYVCVRVCVSVFVCMSLPHLSALGFAVSCLMMAARPLASSAERRRCRCGRSCKDVCRLKHV